jgi:hypothetical protein
MDLFWLDDIYKKIIFKSYQLTQVYKLRILDKTYRYYLSLAPSLYFLWNVAESFLLLFYIIIIVVLGKKS